MSQALYRKYRSRSLDEVVGQEHITQTLARALKAGRVNHAYLFTGPKGVGKTSVARILAHAINKLPYSDTPSLDIIEIDAASNRRIDDIRDLREKVHIAPVSAPYKVYIIDEVHMLTGESFNALLKTLEEPPAHVVFILATTESHKLPATIISRTQRFSFRPARHEALVVHLKHIADKEGIKINDEALQVVAEHADGSFRDALSLLDQLTHISTGEITADKVASAVGLMPKELVNTLIAGLVNRDRAAVLAALNELETSGGAISSLVNQLSRELSKHASQNSSLYSLIDTLLDVPRAYNPRLKLLTALMSSLPVETTKADVPVPKPVPEPAPKVESAATAELEPEPAPTTNGDLNIDDKSWDKVLSAIKKVNSPLHTVLKHARMHFEAGDQTLTLGFKYALHKKKLDDPKQKAILAKAMIDVLGGAPTIKVVNGAVTADPSVDKVAEIMGGGEQIEV